MRERVSREWLDKAKEDLVAAEILLDAAENRVSFLSSTIGFHSQQAVEKSLKAALVMHKIEFKKSHDIYYLINLIEESIDFLNLRFVKEHADILNEFAVNSRYPGQDFNFSIKECQDAYNIAEKLLGMVNELLDDFEC